MNIWSERPVVLMALLVAAVVVSLGLASRTRIRLRHRKGLFYAALVTFLGAWACGASRSEASAPEKPGKAEGDGSPARAMTARGLIPPELADQNRWDRFKAVWKELNEAGRKTPVTEGAAALEFGGAVPHETRQAMLLQLADAVGCTPQQLQQTANGDLFRLQESPMTPGCLPSLPSRILVHAALARIWAMGPDHTMMMHMLPPPDLIFHNRLKAKLQVRFEALVAMTREGKLTPDDFDAAMTQLEQQLYHMLVFELVRPHLGTKMGGLLAEPSTQATPEQQANEWIGAMHTWCKNESEPRVPGDEAQVQQVKASCARVEQSLAQLDTVRADVLGLLKMLQE